MGKEELKFDDDKLFVYTPLPQYGDEICKVQLVMTKEIFQECYKRWIEQEPKKGLWIRWYEQKENDLCIENIPHCKCSECGKEYDPYSSQFIKYCSECGAKMIEPQESEDKE